MKKVNDETTARLNGNGAALEDGLRAIYEKFKTRVTRDLPPENLGNGSEAGSRRSKRSSESEEPLAKQGADDNTAEPTQEETQQTKLASLHNKLHSAFDTVCQECGIPKVELKKRTE
jgi:hypothetical protein